MHRLKSQMKPKSERKRRYRVKDDLKASRERRYNAARSRETLARRDHEQPRSFPEPPVERKGTGLALLCQAFFSCPLPVKKEVAHA
jgi:hypothetical protein